MRFALNACFVKMQNQALEYIKLQYFARVKVFLFFSASSSGLGHGLPGVSGPQQG
jgi:hypothetical protein